MAVTTYPLTRPYARAPRRGPITRLLEDERWLAFVLMVPTMVLLLLFIA
jgi:multiple sugar transport system permease protein